MLYWCDARTDKIERINLETGENREVVLSSNNMDMFSVSVFESYIYWSDRSVHHICIPQPINSSSQKSSSSLLFLHKANMKINLQDLLSFWYNFILFANPI